MGAYFTPDELTRLEVAAGDATILADDVVKVTKAAEAAYLKNPTDLNLKKAMLAQKEHEILNPIVPVDKTVAGMLSHKYPIMNQAQRQAKLDRDNAKLEEFFKASEMDNAVRAETAALAAEAGGVVDLSVLPNYSRLAKAAEIDDFARISRTAELAKAGEVAKIGEAYGLARKEAGNMYPAVAQTGMVTKAADLARIPNITRPWKAAEIADKAAIPYQTIARTVKASEMADQFTNPDIPAIDIPVAPDKGPVLTPESEFVYKPHLRPEEKERQTMEVPEVTRPGWKLPQEFPDSTTTGNYYSADFEDEYWNTPAGVQEAIGVWGRPVGNRIGNKINWGW